MGGKRKASASPIQIPTVNASTLSTWNSASATINYAYAHAHAHADGADYSPHFTSPPPPFQPAPALQVQNPSRGRSPLSLLQDEQQQQQQGSQGQGQGGSQGRVQCLQCPRTFSCTATARRHELTHTSSRFECDICGKRFTQSYNVILHKRTHEEGYQEAKKERQAAGRAASQIPDLSLSSSDRLPVPAVVVQDKDGRATNQVKFKCPHCPQTFSCSSHVRRHERVHTAELFVCEVCGTQFTQRSTMRVHMRNKHPEEWAAAAAGAVSQNQDGDGGGQQQQQQQPDPLAHAFLSYPFRCSVCPTGTLTETKFRFLDELQEHNRKEHPGIGGGGAGAPKDGSKPAAAVPRPYQCNMCPMTFLSDRRAFFREHMKYHATWIEAEAEAAGAHAHALPQRHRPLYKITPETRRIFARIVHGSLRVKYLQRFDPTIALPACSVCGLRKTSAWEVTCHEKRVHPNPNPKAAAAVTTFACSVCGNKYRAKSDLHKHTRRLHADAEVFQGVQKLPTHKSKHCSREFRYRRECHRHNWLHEHRGICLPRREEAKTKTTESKSKNAKKCDLCGEQCPSGLVQHFQQKHGAECSVRVEMGRLEIRPIEDSHPEVVQGSGVLCTSCGEWFKGTEFKIHLALTPESCGVGQSHRCQIDLDTQLDLNDDEDEGLPSPLGPLSPGTGPEPQFTVPPSPSSRPYQCTICPMTFQASPFLDKHMKYHATFIEAQSSPLYRIAPEVQSIFDRLPRLGHPRVGCLQKFDPTINLPRCPICAVAEISEGDLKLHMRAVHEVHEAESDTEVAEGPDPEPMDFEITNLQSPPSPLEIYAEASPEEVDMTPITSTQQCQLCDAPPMLKPQLTRHIQDVHLVPSSSISVTLNRMQFKYEDGCRFLSIVRASADSFHIPWHICGKCGRAFAFRGDWLEHRATCPRQYEFIHRNMMIGPAEWVNVVEPEVTEYPGGWTDRWNLHLFPERMPHPSTYPGIVMLEGAAFCGVCWRHFFWARHIYGHLRRHQEEAEAAERLKNSENTEGLWKNLDDGRIQCKLCERAYGPGKKKVDAARYKHYAAHHRTEDKEFVCDVCGKRLANVSTYERHKRMHTGERPYACHAPSCTAAFCSPVELWAHKRDRHDKPSFQCSSCGKISNNYHVHLYHMNRHRLGLLDEHGAPVPQETKCPDCGKEFKYPSRLRSHRIEAHGATLEPGNPTQNRRSFTCELCARDFTERSSLQRHRITEHPAGGVKPKFFECKLCDKGVSLLASMRSHLRSVHKAEIWPPELLTQNSVTIQGEGEEAPGTSNATNTTTKTYSLESYFIRNKWKTFW